MAHVPSALPSPANLAITSMNQAFELMCAPQSPRRWQGCGYTSDVYHHVCVLLLRHGCLSCCQRNIPNAKSPVWRPGCMAGSRV